MRLGIEHRRPERPEAPAGPAAAGQAARAGGPRPPARRALALEGLVVYQDRALQAGLAVSALTLTGLAGLWRWRRH